MAGLSRLRSLWRNLAHRERVDRDLDDEVRGMFDLLVDEKRRSGLTLAQARRAAAIEMGQVEVTKARIRDARAGAFIDGVRQDARYGARVLRRNPIFAVTAALSLAVGIGATTTIFTVANALLLRAAPGVTEPDRLVDVVPAMKGHFGIVLNSYADYLDLGERAATLDGVYGYQLEPVPLSLRPLRREPGQEAAAAERVFAGVVTLNYFQTLGVPAVAGRVFSARDRENPGAGSLVVLSHPFWLRRFNGDRSIVGEALQINGRPFTVAGIAREGFRGMSVAAPDIWIPAAADTAQLVLGGRLKPGFNRAQADAEVKAIGRLLDAERPGKYAGIEWSVATASPIPALLRGVAAAFVALLLALVSLVLVIACANVTGVLLARATARRREMAVRVTLGAGRARLVRQLLTETALLFALGAAAGVALARLMTSLLLATLPAFPVPINLSVPLDARVVAFAATVSLVAAIVSGIAPALHASRADVVSALKDESQGPSDRLRLRNAFVIAQVAFSILLVVAAGLLGRALGRVTGSDPGFDARNIEVASVDLSMGGYTEAGGRQFAAELLGRLRQLPGVESATLADRIPGGPLRTEAIRRRPGDPGTSQPVTPASWTVVEPGYFQTLRIPFVQGRDFTAADGASAQPVAIVDESTARATWPGEDAVGKYLAPPSEGVPRLVVGVVRDVKSAGRQREMAALVIYAPLQQRYGATLSILARTRGARQAAAIRSVVTAMNRNLPILEAHTLEERQLGPVVLQLRIAALVSGSVGLVGLLLASIGIYGVTAHSIARRTREIGVRLALGAQRGDVVWMVLRQGLSLVTIGAAIGLVLAAAAARLLGRLLFGLPPLDPVTFGGAAVLFAAIGAAACYLPIRRALRVNPVEALRYE